MSEKLQLTQKALTEAKDLRAVFELEPFKYNFVDNYLKTTGRKNGAMIFERERVLFMKALSENKKLEKCERFTIYAAFIELAVSGLTLNDGITYIIPYGNKAQFQIGWKGRLEQISHIDIVQFANEPQLVYTSELDDFDFELGENPRIIKHKPSKTRGKSKDDLIEWVYFIINTTLGPKTWMMSRTDVHQIRDQYSQTYRSYMAECVAKNVEPGKPIEKKMTGSNGPYTITIDPPFWVTSEGEAFKKTIVKRGYKFLPKTPRLKALDERIKGNLDIEDGTQEETHDINYGLANEAEAAAAPPATTAEIKTTPPPADKKKGSGKAKKEETKKPAETQAPAAESETKDVDHEEVTDQDTDTEQDAEQDNGGPAASEVNPASELPDLSESGSF